MCINYTTVKQNILREDFQLEVPEDWNWPDEIWQDFIAPVIVDRGEGPQPLLATYGMIPQRRLPADVRVSTMNARAETVGEKKSYRDAWNRCQLCLVPMVNFFEPCYESGRAERWQIGMASGAPFAVAGLIRAWKEADNTPNYSFTQLTINADQHPFMRRMHKPNDEKRSLVIVPEEDYEDWLTCRNPEIARSFLQPFSAELMAGQSLGRYGKR